MLRMERFSVVAVVVSVVMISIRVVGAATEIAGLRGDLSVIGYGNFVVADAAVEVGEQGGGFVGDNSGFEVGAGEVADGFEGTPSGFDEDFDFAFAAAMGNSGSEVARDAPELR